MNVRPVVRLTGVPGPVPEILVAYISPVTPAQLLPTDLILDPSTAEFRSTHLKIKSVLRLRKLATVHCSSLARSLGSLDASSLITVFNKLKQLLAL